MTTGEAIFWTGFGLFVAAAYAAGASMTMCGLHAAGCRPRVAALGGLFFPTLPLIGAICLIGWAVSAVGRALLFGAAPCEKKPEANPKVPAALLMTAAERGGVRD